MAVAYPIRLVNGRLNVPPSHGGDANPHAPRRLRAALPLLVPTVVLGMSFRRPRTAGHRGHGGQHHVGDRLRRRSAVRGHERPAGRGRGGGGRHRRRPAHEHALHPHVVRPGAVAARQPGCGARSSRRRSSTRRSVAGRASGRFGREILVGADHPAWSLSGSAARSPGAAGGGDPDPAKLGSTRSSRRSTSRCWPRRRATGWPIAAVVLSAAITFALMPVAPAGVPVVAASAAALIGLRR